MLLSTVSREACASRSHFLFIFVFLFLFFCIFYSLSPDFHEVWHSVMSTCLITEVKQQWIC